MDQQSILSAPSLPANKYNCAIHMEMHMALKARAKLSKSPNSATLYLAIPADMVKDSQFPFSPGERVALEIKPAGKRITILGEDEMELEEAAAFAGQILKTDYPEQMQTDKRRGVRKGPKS